MIGIIFNPTKLYRIINKIELHENVQFYYDLAEMNNVDLFFYSMKDLSNRKKVKGYLYRYETKELICTQISIPTVNILRTNVKGNRMYFNLKKIEQNQNVRFINMHSGRNKYRLYQFLNENEHISPYLPDTDRFSYKSLIRFIQEYKRVIIKPMNGALGERISSIERKDNGFVIHSSWYKNQQDFCSYIKISLISLHGLMIHLRRTLSVVLGLKEFIRSTPQLRDKGVLFGEVIP